jgi:hypothetical protein
VQSSIAQNLEGGFGFFVKEFGGESSAAEIAGAVGAGEGGMRERDAAGVGGDAAGEMREIEAGGAHFSDALGVHREIGPEMFGQGREIEAEVEIVDAVGENVVS